jgi:hypothetical protein
MQYVVPPIARIRYLGSAMETRRDAAALVRGTDVTTSPAAVRLNRGRPPDRATTYGGAPDAKGGST